MNERPRAPAPSDSLSAANAAASLFAGPGEMRARCREVDWSATPLGPVATWPVSLRTTVATMLGARYPMILFWGRERIQLYNDAYIPTLGGADRHPAALGMAAAECWAGEVWEIVGPQIDEVMATGVATWHEDQRVPLPRHGTIEETYWTYSYGPAYGDDGQLVGVLAVTQETTARVTAESEQRRLMHELAQERALLTTVLEQAPVGIALLRGRVAETLTVELANERYRELMPPANRVLGRELSAVVPGLSGDTLAMHQRVLDSGEPFVSTEHRIPLDRDGDGTPEDYYFHVSHHPLRSSDGRVDGIIVVAGEVTELVGARSVAETALQAARLDRGRAEILLERMAEAFFALDADFRIVAANRAMADRTGFPREALLGRTLWEPFPELQGSVAEEHYRRVSAHQIAVHFTHEYDDGRLAVIAEIDAYPIDDGGVAVFWRDVTERVRASAALAESEARLRAVYDGTYEYIGIIAPDGTVLDCNRASLGFAGSSRSDVLGKPFWDTPWFASTPGAPALLRESVARAAQGEFVRYMAPLIRPSGDMITFDFSLYPIRDARGDVVYIVPEGRDITDRVAAEAALRASEERYRTLFESVHQGFCILDMIFDDQNRPIDYRFAEANPAFQTQTGLVDVTGKTARELVPNLEPHWFEIYGRVATTGESTRFQNGSDAMGRWFDVYAIRVGRPADRRIALLFTDVTAARAAALEREQLLRALELERSRLVDVFRKAPAFLALLRGEEHVFELVNDAYYQLVGHRDLIGKPLREALPEVMDQGFVELLDRVLQTGEAFVGRELPVRVARNPGAPMETRFVDFSYLPITESDGRRSGIIAHGTDVTEQVLARQEVERLLGESEGARKEAEVARAEAEAARAEAESANRAKGEFLAVMSHELRTPLNAIGGYAELMEMGIRGPVTRTQQEDLRRIQTSQRHLLGLINEVLNYAKLETGTVHYDLQDVDLHEALTAAESLVVPQARAKGIRLTVDTCPAALQVRADPEKLRQILVNLLSNAVKFTDSGGAIRIETEAGEPRVAVRVHDTGIGIPADKLTDIFDPFVQVRANLTRPHEGTGLGLAISRDLARGMSGDLSAESTPRVGSVFTLLLPPA